MYSRVYCPRVLRRPSLVTVQAIYDNTSPHTIKRRISYREGAADLHRLRHPCFHRRGPKTRPTCRHPIYGVLRPPGPWASYRWWSGPGERERGRTPWQASAFSAGDVGDVKSQGRTFPLASSRNALLSSDNARSALHTNTVTRQLKLHAFRTRHDRPQSFK